MTTSLQPAYALVPGANLESYVHTVNSIPLLSVEQAREYGLAVQDALALHLGRVSREHG